MRVWVAHLVALPESEVREEFAGSKPERSEVRRADLVNLSLL